MRINTKLLAGAAVVVLLLGVSSQIANHAFAYSSTDKYSHAKAIAEAAGQEQAKIIKEMQEKAKPHPTDSSTG